MTAATRPELTLPFRLLDGPRPLNPSFEWVVEEAVAQWCDYQEQFFLDVVRIFIRPDLTPEQLRAAVEELCALSGVVGDLVMTGRVWCGEWDVAQREYADALAKLATRPTVRLVTS